MSERLSPSPSPRRTFVRGVLAAAVVFAAGMAVATQTGLIGASTAAPSSTVGTAVAVEAAPATPATIIQYRDITIDAPAPATAAPDAPAANDAVVLADAQAATSNTEVVYVDEVVPANRESEHDDEHQGTESHENEGGELDD